MNIDKIIKNIEEKILNGGQLSLEEARPLLDLQDQVSLQYLFASANRIREKFRGNKVDLCSITNAKSGNCSQNCAFCAQSSHHNGEAQVYSLINVEEVLTRARNSVKNKAHRFCIVTSGCNVDENELKQICQAIRLLKKEFPFLKLDASLGKLSPEQARLLKEAGLDRYNHNIETVEAHFSNVCTTHSFRDRLETLKIVRGAGIEVCCGGIIGLGETSLQRIELAFLLRELDVDCVPINFLNPVEGTPFQNNNVPEPIELLKIVALFRLILPKKQIRVCGGRQKNLRQLQSMIFSCGADAIILGDYLTTKGSPAQDDLEMIKDAGMRI